MSAAVVSLDFSLVISLAKAPFMVNMSTTQELQKPILSNEMDLSLDVNMKRKKDK